MPNIVREVSQEVRESLLASGRKRQIIVSFFPADRANCDCKPLIEETKLRLSSFSHGDREFEMHKMGTLACPRDKMGMRQYVVKCRSCGSKIAVLWARDERLTDWCDLHYICEYDLRQWQGAMTVHISPIDEHLAFECACGQDTRDFRANQTLHPSIATMIEKQNAKGRDFGMPSSKFLVREARN